VLGGKRGHLIVRHHRRPVSFSSTGNTTAADFRERKYSASAVQSRAMSLDRNISAPACRVGEGAGVFEMDVNVDRDKAIDVQLAHFAAAAGLDGFGSVFTSPIFGYGRLCAAVRGVNRNAVVYASRRRTGSCPAGSSAHRLWGRLTISSTYSHATASCPPAAR